MKISPPLDLQELVDAAGGHEKITPDMWGAFDRAMEAYQQARRDELNTERLRPRYWPGVQRRG
jgi:hypothetical protein